MKEATDTLGTVIHFLHNLTATGGVWSVVRTLARQHRAHARLALVAARKGALPPWLEQEVRQLFDSAVLVDRPASFASSYTHPIAVQPALDALGVHADRGPLVCHFHAGPLVPWFFRLPRTLPRGVWVATFHGSRGNFFDTSLHTFPRRLAGILGTRTLVRRGFSLVAVSQRSASDCAAHYRVDRSCFEVVYNGVSSEGVPAARAVRKKTDAFHLGFVGTVQASKGWHKVVEAARLLRGRGHPVTCSVVGAGIEATKLRRLAEEHADWLRAPGLVTDVTRCVLPTLDALVLPSEFEGHAMVLLEAMSCGVPCVCSDVGGNAETVRDGEEGWILRRNTPDEIAECVQRLIDHPELGYRMGAQARRRYEAMFTDEIMANAYERLYRKRPASR